jgi:hypothetical protein
VNQTIGGGKRAMLVPHGDACTTQACDPSSSTLTSMGASMSYLNLGGVLGSARSLQ